MGLSSRFVFVFFFLSHVLPFLIRSLTFYLAFSLLFFLHFIFPPSLSLAPSLSLPFISFVRVLLISILIILFRFPYILVSYLYTSHPQDLSVAILYSDYKTVLIHLRFAPHSLSSLHALLSPLSLSTLFSTTSYSYFSPWKSYTGTSSAYSFTLISTYFSMLSTPHTLSSLHA